MKPTFLIFPILFVTLFSSICLSETQQKNSYQPTQERTPTSQDAKTKSCTYKGTYCQSGQTYTGTNGKIYECDEQGQWKERKS